MKEDESMGTPAEPSEHMTREDLMSADAHFRAVAAAWPAHLHTANMGIRLVWATNDARLRLDILQGRAPAGWRSVRDDAAPYIVRGDSAARWVDVQADGRWGGWESVDGDLSGCLVEGECKWIEQAIEQAERWLGEQEGER